MNIVFREFNPFDLWIWLEFETVSTPQEQQYVEEVFNSWFYLGKLGAFNAESLQVNDRGIEISYMDYSEEQLAQAMIAPMHNMGEFEYLQTWGRCWFDLGTSDAIALDILINALTHLSNDYIAIRQVIFGGENEDWPVEKSSAAMFN
ncbi:DUF3531 family protein [Spirulina major CS-329]|uniref:DUF3531 family protein n=1 Tax=Spirulina TaxID=1154 RepID=UPI00232AB5E5|nr:MULTISPECIES: DUF3531 family protein [Spirulina]MDB9496923.1 DUF3531 family protein [Spirulina subsalsa CS-330]MDB9501754.1 DUF3531 family protein [Spirulina major CS-329]